MKARNSLLFAAVSVIAMPVPALAQNQATEPSSEDIIITARKREEAAIDVPVIATTITEERLDQLAVRDVKDLARLVPGLTLSQNTGILGIQPSLRGIGTNAINAGIDQSISLNVDGLQLTQGVSYSAAFFDVERVEVLKGPQPLFFGKNSPGGVIVVRTADPGDELEVIARAGYETNAREIRSELIFSTPITDTLGIRIATLYDRSEGYFKNLASNAVFGGRNPFARRNPNTENVQVRGTLVFRPNDQFDARLKYTHTRDHLTGGFGNQFVSCPDGFPATNSFTITLPPAFGGTSTTVPFMGGEDCKKDRFFRLVDFDPAAFPPAQGTIGVPNGGTGFTDTDQDYGTLELNYRPTPELTVTSVTTYYKLDIRSGNNGSVSTQSGPPFISAGVPLSRKDFTQEIRINSDWEGPLNFTAGGFFQDGKLVNNVRLVTNTALPGPFNSLPRPLGAYDQTVDIKTWSAFGQLRWQATPELEIAPGIRWTSEKRELTFITVVPLAPPAGSPSGTLPFPAGVFPTSVPKISSSNWSPELTITYEPTQDLTIFAAAKRGYKSGSFNLTAPTFGTVNTDFSFGDEKATGAEAGVKARLLDRQMFLSVAAYYYKYKGLQVGVVTPIAAGGVPVNRTINAGGAKAYGLDLDMTYQPRAVPGLNVHAAAAWNIAKFTDLAGVPCWGGQLFEEGCTLNPRAATATEIAQGAFAIDPATGARIRYTGQDLTGKPLNRAPKWQANVGFSYEFPIGGDLKLAVANENQFVSKQRTNLGLRDDFWQDGFFKMDASLALKDVNDVWEFAIIGKNIFDKLTSTNCNNTNSQAGAVFGGQNTGASITAPAPRGAAGVDELLCFMDRGREVWLRFTFRGRK